MTIRKKPKTNKNQEKKMKIRKKMRTNEREKESGRKQER